MASRKIKVSGFTKAVLVQMDKEKASGRTKGQSEAKKLMDMSLYLAASGEPWKPYPPPMIQPGAWRGLKRGYLWEIWQDAERGRRWLGQQIRKSHDVALRDSLAAMYFGLACLMESASLNDEAGRTPRRKGGPSAGELCSNCRDRIERRYLPPLDPSVSAQKVSAIRLYFPAGDRRRRRTVEIRAAWRIASKHRLFPSKGKFALYANKKVHLSPRWILKCITDPIDPSERTGRQQA